VSTLELNIKAKKVKPPTPPPHEATEGLKLEVGKKYITNEGVVLEMVSLQGTVHQAQDWLRALYPDEGDYYFYWEPDGTYVGAAKTHRRSIRREWTPTWELEEAWMREEKLEYFESEEGVWRLWNPYSYTLIQNTFGNSITTKEFWAKNYAPHCINVDGTFRVRRKQ
jgi:hypothetical protein